MPTSADTVTFDANSFNTTADTCTVNADVVGSTVVCGAMGGILDFSANNNSPTFTTFSCSGTGVRTLNMGNGTWTITGNATTIINFSIGTSLTFSAGSSVFNCTYSGSTGTRTIVGNGSFPLNSLKVSAGSDAVAPNGLSSKNIDFTGYTGAMTITTNNMVCTGNITFGTGMTTVLTGNSLQLTGTGIQNLTSNGVTLNFGFNVNGVGGTVLLVDALVMNSTKTLTLSQGTFNANNNNLSVGAFSASNSSARTITMGSGTWTLTGTGTIWTTATTSGLTLNANASTIQINNASASSKTFSSGTATFNNLQLTGTGSGTFIIGTQTNTNTFNNFTVDTPPHTVQIFAGKTLVVTNPVGLVWSGTSGNLNTFQSTTGGVAWTISMSGGIVSEDFISLQDSAATGGAIFYAGANSTNVSGNTGWIFTVPPAVPGTSMRNALANAIMI